MNQDALLLFGKSIQYTKKIAETLAGGLRYKGSVATYTSLPTENNEQGHMYTTNDTGHEWVWTIKESSGSLENWLDLSKDLVNYAKLEYVNQIKANLESKDTELDGKITTEKDRAEGVELGLSNSIDAVGGGLTTHVNNKENPHEVTKAQVGLSEVDNTSDINKPISTATQTALDNKQDTLTAGDNIQINNNVISSIDNPDNKTIVINANNKLETVIGGYYNYNRYDLIAQNRQVQTDKTRQAIITTQVAWLPGDEELKISITGINDSSLDRIVKVSFMSDQSTFEGIRCLWYSSNYGTGENSIEVYIAKDLSMVGLSFHNTAYTSEYLRINYLQTVNPLAEISPINTKFINVDNNTIKINDSNQLYADLSSKQDTLTAGNNIQINNNVISATDTIYDDTEVRGLINTEASQRETADETLQANINTKQDIISDLTTIREGAAAGSTAIQPAAISDMATQTWANNTFIKEHQSLSEYRKAVDQDTIDSGK